MIIIVKKMMWGCLVFILAAISLVFAGEIPEMPVTITTTKIETVPVMLRGSGHLEPYQAINIKSRIDGRLEKILVNDGAIVKKGDQLFEIDTVPYQLAVNQAKASLDKAEANSTESKKLADISSKLFKKEIIAKEELDKVQATAQEAKASVEEAEAALAIANQNLKYCKITASIDGMLGRRLISEGNLISAYKDIIMTLNDITKFKVIFSLPSSEFKTLKKYYKDFPLKVRISNPEDKSISLYGELNYVANQIDNKTGMFEVQGIINNTKYNFWPGEYVIAEIILEMRPNSVVIPARALVDGANNTKMVYVVNNNTAQPIKVEAGWYDDDGNAVIIKGLKKGDKVVTGGIFKLYPGARVKIVKSQNMNQK